MATDLHFLTQTMQNSKSAASHIDGTFSKIQTLTQITDSALLDRLCSPLSPSPSDNPSSTNPDSSPTSTNSTSSVRSIVLDPTHSTNSSILIDEGRSQLSPRCKEDVNWCDRAEILRHLDLFDEKQQILIRNVTIKQQDYSDGFNKGNYFENIYPVIASGFVDAEKMVYCGAQFKYGRRACRKWHFCSRCAYYRGSQSLLRYEAAFTKTSFSHLTCSFDDGLLLDSTNTVRLQNHWKANELAIRKAIEEGLFDGAYIVHELAILNFLPLRVLPHSHILVSGDALSVDHLALISNYVSGGDDVMLTPSLVNKKLDDKEDFGRVIHYQTKAIKLHEPYTSAMIKHGRGRIRVLNLEMREFLDAFSASINGFPKIVRVGNLHPQRGRGYIGAKIPKAKKKHGIVDYGASRTIIDKS